MLKPSHQLDLPHSPSPGGGVVRSRLWNTIVGSVLAAGWTFFAIRHIEAFQQTGQYVYLVFCGSETLIAGLILLRRVPRSVSEKPIDWVVGIVGTAAPILLIPGGAVVPYGEHLIVTGVILQVLAAISLGGSFAIVAANRAIKTSGMYRFVRHPMYAGYVPLYVGYLLLNASLGNLVLVVLALAFVVLRISAEESHLSGDPTYQAYADRTRWRLLPFVY